MLKISELALRLQGGAPNIVDASLLRAADRWQKLALQLHDTSLPPGKMTSETLLDRARDQREAAHLLETLNEAGAVGTFGVLGKLLAVAVALATLPKEPTERIRDLAAHALIDVAGLPEAPYSSAMAAALKAVEHLAPGNDDDNGGSRH